MLLKIAIFLIAFICLAHGHDNKARYDNYRMYRVTFTTEEQLKVFQEAEARSDSYIFIGHARDLNQRLTILVAAHKIAEFSDIIEEYKIDYTILDNNFQAKIDAQERTIKPQNATADEFGWKNYYHLDTIHAWLDHLCEKYKNVVKPIVVGRSYEGNPIKGVKLSFRPNNTAIFIEGGIHAREWISPATATFILNQLVSSDVKEIQEIAHNFDWIVFPVINPDGYKYSFEKDRMWRKTRQPHGSCRGADLNRNWDSAWNQTGSSPDPCAYDFAGSSVYSEPEAKQLANYLESIVKPQHIQTYISLHSYSQLVMFPHAHTAEKAENYDDLKAIGQKTIAAIGKRNDTHYVTGSVYETIYPSSGSSHDWAYTKLKIPISFTFELRGPTNSTDMFILPADQIEPVGWETLDGFIALLKEAKARGYYDFEKIAAGQTGKNTSARLDSFSMINIAFALIMAYIFSI